MGNKYFYSYYQFGKLFPSSVTDSAKAFSLNYKSKSLFSFLATKYQDPHAIDKILKTTKQLNEVNDVMSDSITQMLKNQSSAENTLTSAEQLTRDALVFKKTSKQLKNHVKCRIYKVIHICVCEE